MNIKIAIFGLLSPLLFCGCGRQVQHNLDVINLRSVDEDLVLAEIGHKAITCGDVRTRMDFERGLWTFKNAKLGAAERDRGLDLFTRQRLNHVLSELIHQKAADIWAKEKRISLTENEQQAEIARMLMAFRFKGDISQFADAIGCDSAYVSRQFCTSALVKKIRECEAPASKTVTEREVDEGLQRLSDYYDRAIASNAVTWATCSNLIRRLERGLDFAKAGETYGYNNGGEGEKWASFSRDELEDATLREWAFTAPVGAMRIFELDDGISIVKVIGIENRMGDKAEVDLARINFAMIEPEPEPRTREHVRRELLKWKAENAQKRLFEAILKKYPLKFLHEKAHMAY